MVIVLSVQFYFRNRSCLTTSRSSWYW